MPARAKYGHRRFPGKLYKLLEFATEDAEYCSVISWVDEGRAFAIHDKDRFVKNLIPKYFNQTKYRSFVSQNSQLSLSHPNNAFLVSLHCIFFPYTIMLSYWILLQNRQGSSTSGASGVSSPPVAFQMGHG